VLNGFKGLDRWKGWRARVLDWPLTTRRRSRRLQGGTQELIKIGRFRRGGLFGKWRTGSRESVRVQRQLSGRRHGRVIIIVKVHRLLGWSGSRLRWPRGRFADWWR